MHFPLDRSPHTDACAGEKKLVPAHTDAGRLYFGTSHFSYLCTLLLVVLFLMSKTCIASASCPFVRARVRVRVALLSGQSASQASVSSLSKIADGRHPYTLGRLGRSQVTMFLGKAGLLWYAPCTSLNTKVSVPIGFSVSLKMKHDNDDLAVFMAL